MRIPIRSLKDQDSFQKRSHIIYQFTGICDCGSSYIGRAERNLGVRIKENLPRWLQSDSNGLSRHISSSIRRHAVQCDSFVVRTFRRIFRFCHFRIFM